MIDEILKIVLLVSVGQGITFSSLLVFKSTGDRWANIILAGFILATIIPLWNEYVASLPSSDKLLAIHMKVFYLPMVYGPLLYLYTLRFTRADQPSRQTWSWLIMGPVLGSIFVTSHFYFSVSGFSQFTWYIFYFVINLQILACLIASWLRLKQHNSDIKQNLSNLDKSKLDWLKLLMSCYFLLLIVDFAQSSAKLMQLPVFELMHLLVSVSAGLFIFFIGLWGLSKPEIHFEQVLVKANRKYDNSSLSQTKALNLIKKLDSLMTSEEVFLNNEISLVSLSKKLDVTPHHLSQALNEQLGQNFYDYINSARVNRAKEMLLDNGFQKTPIIDIAYQVGFNNKTSFNNAFKRYTKVTPSQFRAKLATAP